MKKLIYFTLLAICISISCNSTKKSGTAAQSQSINGSWELTYINGPRIAFDGLFPERKPFIAFNEAEKRVNGNSSCNNFFGSVDIDRKKLRFHENMAMTRMACLDGNGETVFMETLQKVNGYNITDNGLVLNLMLDDQILMKFTKKE